MEILDFRNFPIGLVVDPIIMQNLNFLGRKIFLRVKPIAY